MELCLVNHRISSSCLSSFIDSVFGSTAWFSFVGGGFLGGRSREVVGHATQHVRSGFPLQGSNPCLWQWKHSLNHWTFSEPGRPLIQHLDLLPTLSLIPPSFLSIQWKILILPLLNSHQQIFWIQIWTLANFRDSEVWNLQKEGFLKYKSRSWNNIWGGKPKKEPFVGHPLSKVVLFKQWSLDQKHQHHPRTR